jgi:tetratricopeptide (TPR) repeat protein
LSSGRLLAVIAWVGLAITASAPARAADATVTAAMAPEGYGRIVFSFDRLPGYDAKLANNVLVVSFDDTVKADFTPLARGLGNFVNVIRRDPDGHGLRIALAQPARLSVNEAGDKLFLDLLPSTWTGTPPPLPKDVVTALGREAREARVLKAEEELRRLRPKTALEVTGAQQPTFSRLSFKVDDGINVGLKRIGDKVAVTFGASLAFDVARARAALPVDVADIETARTNETLVVMIPAPAKRDVRGFREQGSYILDIDTGERKADAADDRAAPHDEQPEKPVAAPAAKPTPAPVAATPAEKPAPVVQPVAAPVTKVAETAPVQPVVKAAPAAKPVQATPGVASVVKAGDTLRLVFPFAQPTPAAIFRRNKTLWAVFDQPAELGLDAIVKGSGGLVTAASQSALDNGRLVRLTLSDPRLLTVSLEGSNWVISLGDDMMTRSSPLTIKPAFGANGRSAIEIEAPGLGTIRQIRDPDIGDALSIATLAGPARGVVRPQQFIEFSVLGSGQGVAISPVADDLHVNGDLDRIIIRRDSSLALSMLDPNGTSGTSGLPSTAPILNGSLAADEAARPFNARENALMELAAMAPLEERTDARLNLARFYQLRARPADAKAVVEATVEDDKAAARDPRAAILLAASDIQLGRSTEGLALLSKPDLAASSEAALWRAAALADLGRVGPARDALRSGGSALPQLPGRLQSRFIELAVSLALDAGDRAQAVAQFERLEVLPTMRGIGGREIMRARVYEAVGEVDKALTAYDALVRGPDPEIAAEAELRSVELGLKSGKVKADAAIERLGQLVTGWRGDWIEAEALAQLVDLYGDVERWRDAFTTLRTAVSAFPDAESSRSLQEKMQDRFVNLFLGGGLDRISKLDALSLFYDFQEMSPSGKRGDELVRRLADKLVDVDLLDQASALLDYQIDNRLTGAARAQVAARAALIDLMNNKPAKAVDVLRRTRQADLPASLANTRLVLEARALAMSGRTDLALEMAEGIDGAQGAKLAADMLWTARRWADAGEAIERLLGAAWKSPAPLDSEQRTQVMRAAIALSLAGDAMGVDRLRNKFASKMTNSPEAQSFDVVTAPVEMRGDAFREIARSVATSSTFDAFMREYKARSAEDIAPDKTASATPSKA